MIFIFKNVNISSHYILSSILSDMASELAPIPDENLDLMPDIPDIFLPQVTDRNLNSMMKSLRKRKAKSEAVVKTELQKILVMEADMSKITRTLRARRILDEIDSSRSNIGKMLDDIKNLNS